MQEFDLPVTAGFTCSYSLRGWSSEDAEAVVYVTKCLKMSKKMSTETYRNIQVS